MDLTRIRELPRRLEQGREALAHRARVARGQGQARFFELRTNALEQVEHLLERAAGARVFSRVAEPAAERMKERLVTATKPRVPNYDDLNARGAIFALRGLPDWELLKVRRYEGGHKNRKTVLDAVEAEIRRRREPVPQAA